MFALTVLTEGKFVSVQFGPKEVYALSAMLLKLALK
jgi:hypothetical protein